MIAYILIGIAAVVVVLLIAVAMQPSQFTISRSAASSAPAEALFALVNDLHKFQTWSPWAKMDPGAKNSYSGPVAGVGAAFSWEGSKDVGTGTMTIVESRPNELVRMRLDFLRPFQATNVAEFTFKSSGNQTQITWSMTGTKCFMGKMFGLLMNCDKMCGDMFSKGLDNMRTLAEAPASETVGAK